MSRSQHTISHPYCQFCGKQKCAGHGRNFRHELVTYEDRRRAEFNKLRTKDYRHG